MSGVLEGKVRKQGSVAPTPTSFLGSEVARAYTVFKTHGLQGPLLTALTV
jgi:hypothetical protein